MLATGNVQCDAQNAKLSYCQQPITAALKFWSFDTTLGIEVWHQRVQGKKQIH
jgi:hypothetical protein